MISYSPYSSVAMSEDYILLFNARYFDTDAPNVLVLNRETLAPLAEYALPVQASVQIQSNGTVGLLRGNQSTEPTLLFDVLSGEIHTKLTLPEYEWSPEEKSYSYPVLLYENQLYVSWGVGKIGVYELNDIAR